MLGAGLTELRGSKYENVRRNYASTMWKWTQEMVDSAPWEAHYWASFLEDFPGDRAMQGEARTLARKLKSDPKVDLALDAEKAIKDFSTKYFEVSFYKEDQKPNPRRSAEAERLAKKFSEIPHGDLIKLLGGKS